MNLVKATKKDMAQIVQFYGCVLEYLENHVNYPKWSEYHPSRQDLEAAVENGTLYLSMYNGKIQGAVVLNEDPEGYYEAGDWAQELKQGEFLVPHILAVDPAFMHKGVGRAIVKRCIAIASERGYKAVRLDVVPENIPAIRLYETLGFRYAGTKDLLRNIEGIPEFGLYERNL